MFEWMEILEWLQRPRTALGRILRWIGFGIIMLALLPIEAVYERLSRRRARRMRELYAEGREAGR